MSSLCKQWSKSSQRKSSIFFLITAVGWGRPLSWRRMTPEDSFPRLTLVTVLLYTSVVIVDPHSTKSTKMMPFPSQKNGSHHFSTIALKVKAIEIALTFSILVNLNSATAWLLFQFCSDVGNSCFLPVKMNHLHLVHFTTGRRNNCLGHCICIQRPDKQLLNLFVRLSKKFWRTHFSTIHKSYFANTKFFYK